MENGARTAEIAERVRVELARRKMKSADLADAAGINRVTLWRRLSGSGRPFTVPELEAIAEVLDLTAAELLGES